LSFILFAAKNQLSWFKINTNNENVNNTKIAKIEINQAFDEVTWF
jgi:hypothetical protein